MSLIETKIFIISGDPMKKIIYFWSMAVMVGCILLSSVHAQTVQAGIFNPSTAVLEVKAMPSGAINNATFTNVIVTIRWLTILDLHLGTISSPVYHLSKVGSEATSGGYTYQRFAGTPDASITWGSGSENSLFTIDIIGAPSTATFELATNDSYTIANNGDWYFEVLTGEITNTTVAFYTPSVDALVPVQMVSFNGMSKGQKVELKWKTASEFNSSAFEVERRTSGVWEKIGVIQASGVSNAPQEYSFIDDIKNISGGNSIRYRLKAVETDGSFTYTSEVEISALPQAYALENNFPNPFNPHTKIQYSLPENAKVRLVIFDIVGRQVAELVNEEQPAGYYEKTFSGINIASGVYFYRITAASPSGNSFSHVKKMLLLK